MRTVLICLALVLASLSSADGGFFSREVVAKPTIPYQRAFVSFKEGRQVMIVESRLRGEAGEYAWLVPVPSETVEVAPIGPGLLDSLEATLEPSVLAEESKLGLPIALSIGALLVLVVTLVARKRREWAIKDFFVMTVVVGLVALVAGSYMNRDRPGETTGGSVASADGGGVQWRRVGAYKYATIGSETVRDPLVWLKREGFAARDTQATIEAYLDEGWAFVALRFDRQNEEQGPHPIKLTFATEKPVYPMRLTAHNAERLELDLFCLSEKVPTATGLELWRAEAIGEHAGGWSPNGHPELRLMAKEGDVLARFRATLDKSDMQRDISFGTAQNQEPQRKQLWSARAAWTRSLWVCLAAIAAVSWLLAFLVVASWPNRRTLSSMLLVGLVIIAGAPLWSRANMTIVDTEVESGTDINMWPSEYAIFDIKDRAFQSRDDLIAAIAASGGPTAPSDTVYGYSLFEEGDSFLLVPFDERANPQEPVRVKKTTD